MQNHNAIPGLDSTNREMCYAYDMIARTNKSFFLTGRAGTGKTTFLQNVQKCVRKNFIVLAPSGVAAIHVGGQTIHSFFGFDFAVQGVGSVGQMNAAKRSLVRHLDTIIIDEVSMVRCDIMDAIDRMLRICRNSSQPFGGIQMILVGDLFQLPPVVTQDDMRTLEIIYGHDCFFFYKARCIENFPLPKIEFRKIYRQADKKFIGILDNLRNGNLSDADLGVINSQVAPTGVMDDYRIILTSYRRDAGAVNSARLDALEGDAFTYIADYEGESSGLKDVAEDELKLKVGAQVMFLKNDPRGRWVNGTLAKVSQLSDDKIFVCLEDSDTEMEVEKETWEAIEYVYDRQKKCCSKTIVGMMTQYPLRLAWAITIHKSQSLTFDKVAIDFGRGAFSFGQAYVALSRARSLEGLRLERKMGRSSVIVSPEVQAFATSFNDEQVISTELTVGQAVNEFERKGDYDGAALTLFRMCDKEAHSGRVALAYDLLNRSLSYVADDDCLFGVGWSPIPATGRKSALLNAAGLLYSGHNDEALRLLASLVKADDGDFNGMYLLARALEIKGDRNMLIILYNQMIDLFNNAMENGLDSPSFRKFKYRLALIGGDDFKEHNLKVIRKLISENPRYDKYHLLARRLLRGLSGKTDSGEGADNPLVAAVFDGKMSDENFLEKIDAERRAHTEVWLGYRRYLNQLKLN